MISSRFFIALALVSVLAVLAGCGGGGSSSSTTEVNSARTAEGPESEKKEFIEEADAVCEAARQKSKPLKEELEKASEGPETPTMIVEVSNLAKKAVPIEEEEAEELRAIEPPSEDASTIGTMLDYLEESNEATLPLADALAAGENSKVEEIEKEEEKADLKAKGIAQGYGFKVCGHEEE